MKYVIATISIYIACISATSALDKPEFHSSAAIPGYNTNHRGEYYRTFSQMSDNCDPELVFFFEMNTSPRTYSYVEVTSPMKLLDMVVEKNALSNSLIKSRLRVKNHGKCQVDIHIYVTPSEWNKWMFWWSNCIEEYRRMWLPLAFNLFVLLIFKHPQHSNRPNLQY